MGDKRVTRIGFKIGIVSGLAAGLLVVAPGAAATTSPGMPYSMEDFGAQLLTSAEVQALIETPPLQDVAGSPSCALIGAGGYTCAHEWPIPPYTYARPQALTIQSYPSPAAAQAAFLTRKNIIKGQAGVQNVIFDGTDDATVSAAVGAIHFGVTSLRRAGNNIVEATCISRTSPGDRVENVNTCTQAMIGTQAPKLVNFVSPKLELPGAPTGVLTSIKGTAITVTWLPPANDGGTPVTTYTATSGELTCTAAPSAAALQSCTAPGAKAGTNYSFTVTATNAVGTGAVSAASSPNKYTAKPTAPLAVKARANGTTGIVSWKKPKETGGLAVQQYVVTAPGGAGCKTIGTSCTVTGLGYSSAYKFTVKAVNGRGTGPGTVSNVVKTGAAPVVVAPVTPDKPTASLS